MIEICTTGAQITVDKLKRFLHSPLGIFLYASITGIIGILILLMFLSMVLSASLLPGALPIIVAFNCAAGGFSLRDKARTTGSAQQCSYLGLATFLTIGGCSALPLFCPWEPLFDSSRYMITGLLALILTYFGVWIANKSKDLNRSK